MVRDRRAWPRDRKQFKVFISDPADALDECYTGWIVDRSAGGVCLMMSRFDIMPGNLLKVQPTSATGELPWVEVEVMNRRSKRSRVAVGCQFVERDGWEKTLLLE